VTPTGRDAGWHDVAMPLDPEERIATGPAVGGRLPPATRMGPVHLEVADLDRSLTFYERALGLFEHDRDGARVVLGTGGEDLLVLYEEPGSQPAFHWSGLYHFALLVDDRAALAAFLVHVAREKVRVTGMSDHFVSEAIYLNDPDEHGIEVYWDRPRADWEGQVGARLTTLPLDTHDLLSVLDDPRTADFEGLPKATTMGHVHLRVADVPKSVRFYRDALGFGLMAELGDRAAFLSAGGYHHHVGANSWESQGRPQAPPGVATLKCATVLLPDAASVDRAAGDLDAHGHEPEAVDHGIRVNDPAGNAIVLRDAAAAG
jgi:catechol 2,3-dioxygenase